VLSNNPKLAEANQEFSAKVGEWDAADASLKTFANMAVAAQVGCSWCLDINYFQAQNQNLDLTKASQVPRWRESEVFTPLERDVMEYAEAMTNTPPTSPTSCRRVCSTGSAQRRWSSSLCSSALPTWRPGVTRRTGSHRRATPKPARFPSRRARRFPR
jgi:alkylhydroperoxidase family enzyme